jgi:Mn2+/Fe2+ NRAMP family transporter
MGVLVNRRATTAAAWIISTLIVALNAYLLYGAFAGG